MEIIVPRPPEQPYRSRLAAGVTELHPPVTTVLDRPCSDVALEHLSAHRAQTGLTGSEMVHPAPAMEGRYRMRRVTHNTLASCFESTESDVGQPTLTPRGAVLLDPERRVS